MRHGFFCLKNVKGKNIKKFYEFLKNTLYWEFFLIYYCKRNQALTNARVVLATNNKIRGGTKNAKRSV